MKITYELSSADLKLAIESWMLTRGKPVTDADVFTVAVDGTVTVVITEPDDVPAVPAGEFKDLAEAIAHAASLPGGPFPVSAVMSPPATVPAIVSPIPPISTTTPGHMVQVDPPLSVTGQATEFGFHDPTDNGLGFFYDPATSKPYQTNNDVIRGVSLPREVLLSTFLKIDSWKTEGITDVWSRNGSTLRQWVDGNKPRVTIDSGGKSATDLPIVDAGPTAGTGNAIDLTGAISKELGTNGDALATYMIVVSGKPVTIRGWDFAKGRVG